VVGAFVFVLLDELAAPWSAGRSIMFGALLIIVVFATPRGMTGAFLALAQIVRRQLRHAG
jgi:ABC-type branched-subunit amino acid transport system permease subunit